MTSAFGGQRSIQLSYGRVGMCITQAEPSGNGAVWAESGANAASFGFEIALGNEDEHAALSSETETRAVSAQIF